MNFLANEEERMKRANVENLSNENSEIIEKLLKDLDDDQKKAAEAPFKDTLIIANAGSGKTRVLTYRVSYLIAKGVPESQIMLLTFTNKAADEMLERVKKILKKDNVGVLSGTFHHVAVVFLRRYAKLIGYKNNFTILTPEDAKDLIGLCRQKYLTENDHIPKKKFPTKAIIYGLYSSSINLKRSVESLISQKYGYSKEIVNAINTIIEDYKNRKALNQGMDFDDLILNFRDLLKSHPDVRKAISSNFPFILVDEYQDINWIQNDIIEYLNEETHNLYVVGDNEQSIYGFRGSMIDYILNFEDNHPNCNLYKIRYNYRSHKEIIDLAVNSINNNTQKYKKEMIPYLSSFRKPLVVDANNENAQSRFIVNEIERQKREGTQYDEIAILVRANYLTKSLELGLKSARIPYRILCGISFFEREHIRDLIAFLKYQSNPDDEIAFSRIANLFSGVGEKTIERIYSALREVDYNIHAINLSQLPFRATKDAKEGIKELFDVLCEISKQSDLKQTLEVIMDINYKEYMQNKFEDYYDRLKDVESLIDSASLYSDIDKFLSDIILDKSDTEEEKEQGCVTITTVHKAKGLEWDSVFLPYLVDEVFPSKLSVLEGNIEEERRLFYVAVTRAKKYLNISFVGDMLGWLDSISPSIFLKELDENIFDYKVVK
ncbi:ATP-dependent helicase [Alkaliphilus sp. B6464]|uniref:ATP-dependent helicase n=1 Tax=Alkaliphilus sp. B6464 TaxID=2731219 RepID=UPI001BAC7A8D|nr:ATP-dependent helicase [Alkaliphilus sp. B6464]QUH22159.1 ATP-dependent helicase [Alkaliphilus sp. B6464]